MGVRNWCKDTAYAIGQSQSTMLRLRMAKIPPPDQVIMNPTAKMYVRGDASRVGDGYRSCQWIWDVISGEKLYNLLDIAGLVSGDFYKLVYIDTDLRDGTTHIPKLTTYSAIMYRPVLSGNEGTPIARSPYTYQSVKITFNRLIEV